MDRLSVRSWVNRGRRGFKPAESVTPTCECVRAQKWWERRTGIGDTPNEFDNSDATGAFCALLHDLLGCGEGIGDATAAGDEHSSGEAGDHGVPRATCRATDQSGLLTITFVFSVP